MSDIETTFGRLTTEHIGKWAVGGDEINGATRVRSDFPCQLSDRPAEPLGAKARVWGDRMNPDNQGCTLVAVPMLLLFVVLVLAWWTR